MFISFLMQQFYSMSLHPGDAWFLGAQTYFGVWTDETIAALYEEASLGVLQAKHEQQSP